MPQLQSMDVVILDESQLLRSETAISIVWHMPVQRTCHMVLSCRGCPCMLGKVYASVFSQKHITWPDVDFR